LSQNLPQGRVAVQIDAEVSKCFRDRIVRTVGDSRDLAAAKVLHDQTFQHVVDLGNVEAEIELCAIVKGSIMLKIPHAAGIEHDLRKEECRSFVCQNRPGGQQE